jgi:hypothetical protein
MSSSRLLFWLTIATLSTATLTACWLGGDDDESAGLVDDDDTDGDWYSDACDINYGIDLGCDSSDAACRHAGLINHDRFEHPDESDCAPALRWDGPVAAVARAHSQDMCDRQFFDHENPGGKDPFDRLDEAGIDWIAAAENIFMACGYDLDTVVTLAEESFMDEPECVANHRSNILSRNLYFVGVGIYECDDGCIYLTQDYVTYDFDDLREDEHEYCPNFS